VVGALMTTATTAFRRAPPGDDDLGANSMPKGAWPPRHDFLASFFFSPVGQKAGGGGGEDSIPIVEGDGLKYLRPATGIPGLGDKLMVGSVSMVRGEICRQWAQAVCAVEGQVPGEEDGAAEEPAAWMLESEYNAFTEMVTLLSDFEVKDDEELNLDQVTCASVPGFAVHRTRLDAPPYI